MKKILFQQLKNLQKKEKSNFLTSLAEFQKAPNFELKIKHYTGMVIADTKIKTIEKIITALQNILAVEWERSGIKNKEALLQYSGMPCLKTSNQHGGMQ